MSGVPAAAGTQEEAAAREAAAAVLLSHSLTLLHAQSAGVSVPAMRLQLLKARACALPQPALCAPARAAVRGACALRCPFLRPTLTTTRRLPFRRCRAAPAQEASGYASEAPSQAGAPATQPLAGVPALDV
jgi:hypothetical protein